MARAQLRSVVQYLRQTAAAGDTADPHLLHRFVAGRDPAAFAAIVRRHGPMVFGVCRRVLRHQQDAEDAFQATFLVLVKKARGLARPEQLGPWLHGVAYRTALKAKIAAVRRTLRETSALHVPARSEGDEVERRDLLARLDEEVQCLPGKYRTPVILCYLQGHSTEEAARRIGCPRGTVLSRLARAKDRLRGRLELRGVGLTMAALTALLAVDELSAALPAVLADATTEAALTFAAGGILSARLTALTEGVLQTMALSKWKLAAAVLMVLTLLGAAAGTFRPRTEAADQTEARREQPAKPAAPDASKPVRKVESDKDKLQGTWVSVQMEQDGKVVGDKKVDAGMRLTFDGDKIQESDKEGEEEKRTEGTFTVDPSKTPKEIDLVLIHDDGQKENAKAIYRLEDDLLILCAGRPDDRPTDFTTGGKAGKDRVLLTFKRSRDTDAQKLQGSWKVTAGDLKNGRVLFVDDRIVFEGDGGLEKGLFQIDPVLSQAITLTFLSGKRKGDKMVILYAQGTGELTLVLPRHAGWPGEATGKTGLLTLTLKRDRE